MGVILANPFADFITIELGHHDVEADEIGIFVVKEFEGFLSVSCSYGFEAILREDFDECLSGVVIVFGDENFDGVWHRISKE